MQIVKYQPYRVWDEVYLNEETFPQVVNRFFHHSILRGFTFLRHRITRKRTGLRMNLYMNKHAHMW